VILLGKDCSTYDHKRVFNIWWVLLKKSETVIQMSSGLKNQLTTSFIGILHIISITIGKTAFRLYSCYNYNLNVSVSYILSSNYKPFPWYLFFHLLVEIKLLHVLRWNGVPMFHRTGRGEEIWWQASNGKAMLEQVLNSGRASLVTIKLYICSCMIEINSNYIYKIH
jgi:hypothetical protein